MARHKPRPTDEILKALANESDRGCVLVGCAWAEDLMRTTIALMVKELRGTGQFYVPPKEYDSLIGAFLDGSLGRASARVSFLRGVGVIDKQMLKALNSLFQLRNAHFAHFAGVSRLNDRRVANLLTEFTKNVVPQRGRGTFCDGLRHKKYSKGRRDFMNAFGNLAIGLLASLDAWVTSRPIMGANPIPPQGAPPARK